MTRVRWRFSDRSTSTALSNSLTALDLSSIAEGRASARLDMQKHVPPLAADGGGEILLNSSHDFALFGFRHSFVLRRSSFVIPRLCIQNFAHASTPTSAPRNMRLC